MKKTFFLAAIMLQLSCSTMNDSLKLGAGIGTLTGAAATYAGHASTGQQPSIETVATGAGIGMVLGLLTSHVVHKTVEEDRQVYQFDQTEIHFGDLPPSPFIMPRPTYKKGGK